VDLMNQKTRAKKGDRLIFLEGRIQPQIMWGQVLFFASQLLTYSDKWKKEGIERNLLELA